LTEVLGAILAGYMVEYIDIEGGLGIDAIDLPKMLEPIVGGAIFILTFAPLF
jgi:hypothetical protein